MAVAKILIDDDYVVMISREENLFVLNYEWSENADRNDVVFMSQEDYYDVLREDQKYFCADVDRKEQNDAE